MLKRMLLGVIAATLAATTAWGQAAIAPTDQAAERARLAKTYRKAYNAMPNTPGSGPYPATMESIRALPNHTMYRPRALSSLGGKKLGLVIWGNGSCADDGASSRLHLAEVASHGYLAIAPGKILTGPSAPADAPPAKALGTTVDDLKAALDWALAENGRRGSIYFNRIGPNLVAVAGYSCGGMQAVQIAADPRIRAVVIHNSGIFPKRPNLPQMNVDLSALQSIHTPVLYIVGNSTDVAWGPAHESVAAINHVPVVLAVHPAVGHEGTFAKTNGGEAARVAVQWLEWQLRGDTKAAHTFTGEKCGLCIDPAWQVERKRIGQSP